MNGISGQFVYVALNAFKDDDIGLFLFNQFRDEFMSPHKHGALKTLGYKGYERP